MNEEYIPIGYAARLADTSSALLRRRIRSGELAEFRDPLDRRKALVRRSDIEPLRQIRPVDRAQLAEASAASAA